ncbi:MAG: hypothetical protein LBK82_08140 [Planctomycetaceae bacterium]|nr:hypothetical protein [Planctomycetaceae bacterium]
MPAVLGTIVFWGCFTVAGVVSAANPVTPSPAADGVSGSAVTQSNVGSGGTAIAGNWGNSGDVGTDGTDASTLTWDGTGGMGTPDTDAQNGQDGVAGGQAGKGGNGGTLTINVTGDADFSTFYPTILGTTGGNSGAGGKGGTGQSGGLGDPLPYPYVPERQSVLNGANGGVGGVGAAGVTGGNGGELIFNLTGGSVSFANNIVFGGTAGNGGSGGQGGTGGPGGRGADSISSFTAGTGGNGGDGGNGGVGGNGGSGGNVTFTVNNGTINFSNATFGGSGGNGGNGGAVGIGGIGGLGGDGNTALNGTAGSNGLRGNGGNGGNGGVGNVTISGGTANFAGTTYFGGNGGAAGTGLTNGNAGANGSGTLTLTSGRVNLNGNTGKLEFRGTESAVNINGGTLSYTGNQTIDVGTGTFTFGAGSTLASDAGTLTINAGNLVAPTTAGITLNVLTSGDFLTANISGNNNLGIDSFDVSGYGIGGAELTKTGNTFHLEIIKVIQNLTWTGDVTTWKNNEGETNHAWKNTFGDYKDFTTADNVTFTNNATQKTVTLDGSLAPTTVNVTGGDYTFDGSGAIVAETVKVTDGASLTFANTVANTYDGGTIIGANSTVNVSKNDSLGSGTVNNSGTLNITLSSGDGELANVLAGTGTINKEGTGKLTLTGNSTETGGKINVISGSLQVGNGTSGSYNGNIVSASDVTFNNDNATVYAGTLSNGGKLVKAGAGMLTLSGLATNGVEINSGSIIVGNVNALGNGVDINTNGTLDVNGISVTSAIDLNGGSLVNNSATAATINDVALSNDSTVGGSGNLTITDTLTSGNNLVKTGTGTTTLTKANTLGTTTVNGGRLELADAGSAGNEIALGNGTALIVNRNGDIASNISGTGNVEILKNSSLTGTLSYTGKTEITGATLTGNVSAQSDLVLAKSATYKLDAANAIKSANVESGSQIDLNGQDLTVTGTLEIIATQNKSDAPIQGNGGVLVLESGSTLKANLANEKSAYQLAAGGTTPVYFADGLTGYTGTGATIIAGGNRLFRVESGLNYAGGNLYYNIKRNFAADLFPNISPQLAPVIDNYQGNNNWVEYMMTNEDDDLVTEKYVQGGLDLANLSNAMSVLYDTQTGINNVLYSRSRHFVSRSKYLTLGQCDPCDSVSCGLGSDREFYVAPIYGNNRGLRLNSGGFRYGYVNDQWAMGVGVDQSYGRTRVGLLGVYGEGKSATRGTLPRTVNETTFGGLFLYTNTTRGTLDLLLSAGYLGMENSLEQITSGDQLTGKITNGLATFSATLTKTLQFDGLYVLPVFGIEYGYYHQGSLAVKYGNDIVSRNAKSGTNLAVIPIGVRFTRNGFAFGGQFNPEFRARYIANVGSVSAEYNTFLVGSPNSALMATRMTDRHAGDIGLGFGWSRNNVTLRGDYGYMFGEHYNDQYLNASASWKF